MAKNGMILYYDLLEQLEDFTNAQFGETIRAVIQYDIDGSVPQFTDPIVSVAFKVLKPMLDRNKEHYEEVCAKRREAGSMGGKQKVANASKCYQMLANARDKDNDKDNDIDNIKGNESKKESVKKEIEPTLDTRSEGKQPKHKFGAYNRVLLTDEEFGRLVEEYGEAETERAITYLDEYIEMKGSYKCQSHNLAIRKWVFTALKEQADREARASSKPQPKVDKVQDALQRMWDEETAKEKNNG